MRPTRATALPIRLLLALRTTTTRLLPLPTATPPPPLPQPPGRPMIRPPYWCRNCYVAWAGNDPCFVCNHPGTPGSMRVRGCPDVSRHVYIHAEQTA